MYDIYHEQPNRQRDNTFNKKYPLLNNYKNIDNYDNKIRAKNILYTLNNFYKLKRNIKKYKDNYSHYYIIHPILRYIALKNNYFKFF